MVQWLVEIDKGSLKNNFAELTLRFGSDLVVAIEENLGDALD